jgi:S1-C subfamily serine protease
MIRPAKILACIALLAVTTNLACSASPSRPSLDAASVKARKQAAEERAASVCRLAVDGDGDGGAGFVLRTDAPLNDIYIVTAFHVVADADRVSAVFAGKAGIPWRLELEVVREDPANDVALLRGVVAGHPLPGLPLSRTKPELGEAFDVYAYPNAAGAPLTLSTERGLVTSLHRATDGSDFLETNAHIDRQRRGSPAVDVAGDVLGIVSRAGVTQTGPGILVAANHVQELYAHYVSPDSAEVVIRRRIGEFISADPNVLSNALSSRLVVEVLPMLTRSLGKVRAKAAALRVALRNRGLGVEPLGKERQDEMFHRILTDDENAAIRADNAYNLTESLRAAVATYFRAIAQQWLGAGDNVTLESVQLAPQEHAIGRLVVTTTRDGVVRVLVGLVFERGTWKVDDLLLTVKTITVPDSLPLDTQGSTSGSGRG